VADTVGFVDDEEPGLESQDPLSESREIEAFRSYIKERCLPGINLRQR
jgi:hypothetical protein